MVGSKAVILKGVKPEYILEAVSEEQATIVWLLVPWAQDILEAIESGQVDLGDYKLDQWRLMHIGAQPVPPSLIKRWRKYFPNQAYDTNYGLSESTGPGCVHLGMDNIHKVGAIGKPGFNWQAKIVDDKGNVLPPGRTGELLVKGPGVMKGYYNNEEETKRVLKNPGGFIPEIWPAKTLKALSIWWIEKRISLFPVEKIYSLLRLRIFSRNTRI